MREKRKPCRKRSLEELNVIDDFLMNAAASDPEGGAEFCRLLLSALLERNITAVTVNTQKVLPAYTPELHGIRMDVEVREETETILNIYDIEPCLYHAGVENLAKRNRFYQGKIDGRYLAGGEKDYSHLPNLYVIMILPFDPFGKDYMVYRFRNRCEELPELDYPDGLRYIYFNTRGRKGGSPDIREILDYLQKSTEENAKTDTLQNLHRHIQKVKVRPEVKEEYMLLEEKINYERNDAKRDQTIDYIIDFLKDYGELSEELYQRIEAETDPDTLKRWVKLAARCGSLNAFREQM